MESEPNSVARRKIKRNTYISVFLFIVGLMMFSGANTYKDFYFEMKARSSGEQINFAALAEFCGWTGGPLPGESKLSWGFRAFWNMMSAMLAMTAISLLAFAFLFGIILGIFYLAGAFK